MATRLLARHQVVATTDLDHAREEVAARYCPHRLALTRPGARLDLVYNSVGIGEDVRLSYMTYGDEVRISPRTFETFFLVQIPLAGSARVRVADRVVRSDRRHASVASPTEHVDMVWSDGCEMLVVYISRGAVERLSASVPDCDERVVFDPVLDLNARAPREWLRLVRLALDDIEAGGSLVRSPLVSSHFEQTLVAGLLAIQRNSVLADGPVPALGSRAVRTVVDLVEAEPARPWRIAELAAHARVSPRTLQEAFKRELGVSPLEQLRRTRLERAHADLLAADPGATSVTDIAGRWGFFHLGRFSQSHRAAYQELPSQTLAR